MSDYVNVRFPQTGKETILRRAEVVKRTGDTLLVKVEGELKPREVDASRTSKAPVMYGRLGHRPDSQPQKSFPSSSNALANMV